jgi:hypothetical protein
MKKTKFILLFSSLLMLFSCSRLSKNLIKKGEFSVEGGVFEDQKWKDEIILNRHSWYQELTLLFDLLIIPRKELGPFENWFSKEDLYRISECKDLDIVVTYYLDKKRLGPLDFWSNIEKIGGKKVSLVDFSKQLKIHPDFLRNSLNLYQIKGICWENLRTPSTKTPISMPGFSKTDISFRPNP